MKIYRTIADLPTNIQRPIITFGSFDGVHLGHRFIFEIMQSLAKEVDGETVVTTFDPHPRKVIYPKDSSMSLITTTAEKIELLKQLNIDHLVILPFSIEFSQMSPAEYIESFIIKHYKPHTIVIGYDHRFGLNRQGNIDTLKAYANEGHFAVKEISQKKIDSMKISSTEIRKAIKQGEIDKANTLLGHRYRMSGSVIHGEKLGEKLGYRTANLNPTSSEKLIPFPGIYAVFVHYDGFQYKGMLYIGTKPTIRANGQKSIEVHIIEFNEIVYGKTIEIEFIEFIRPDATFNSLEELKAEIDSDKQLSLKIFNEIQASPKNAN